MNNLFHGFKFIRSYIDDLVVFTKRDWTDHAQKLKSRINKLNEKGIKCGIDESFFGTTEMEYLGFYVTCCGIKPININIESITNMKPPTSQKQV